MTATAYPKHLLELGRQVKTRAAGAPAPAAVNRHVEEAWQPLEFRVCWRVNEAREWTAEAQIRTGPYSAYGGSSPSRGVAICRAALFLAADRAPKWERPE